MMYLKPFKPLIRLKNSKEKTHLGQALLKMQISLKCVISGRQLCSQAREFDHTRNKVSSLVFSYFVISYFIPGPDWKLCFLRGQVYFENLRLRA